MRKMRASHVPVPEKNGGNHNTYIFGKLFSGRHGFEASTKIDGKELSIGLESQGGQFTFVGRVSTQHEKGGSDIQKDGMAQG